MKNINDIDTKNQINYINNKASKIIEIPLSSILLKEKMHITGDTTTLTVLADKLKNDGIKELNNVLLVRPNPFGGYYLVTGFKGYILAQKMGVEKVKVIVVWHNRTSHINKVKRFKVLPNVLSVEQIVIDYKFKAVQPHPAKIQKAKSFYLSNNRFDKPVKLNIHNMLIDGYARYIAALELGLNEIEVTYEG
jgi:hypothetical protein